MGMTYKLGSIQFKMTGYGWVEVTDVGHVCKFKIGENYNYDSITQKEFNVICTNFLNRPEFENLLRVGEVSLMSQKR